MQNLAALAWIDRVANSAVSWHFAFSAPHTPRSRFAVQPLAARGETGC
jgi:hypothetical protein